MSGHARERAAWFLAALACAVLAMAPAGSLPLPVAAAALTVALAIVPGAWLARQLAPGEASDARAALALLLAPFASGVLVVLPRLAGLPGDGTARGLTSVLALGSAWEALRFRQRETTTPSDAGVWTGALLVGLALALAHAASPALSGRSDGSFHAGVVWAAVRALPPEDPFFAGLALHYFWGLHAWCAAWIALAPGLGAYAPLVASSALAALAALLAVGALARRLGASPRTSLLAQALALAGAAPATWLVLVLRALHGDERGTAEFARSLEHGADAALRSLDPGFLHPSLVLPLDKFVVITPFAWGLAGVAVLALAVDHAFESGGWRAWLRVAWVTGAVLFAHPVAGLALALAAAAGVTLASLRFPAARPAAARVGSALACGVLVMSPYLLAVAGPAASGGVAAGFAHDLRGVFSALFAGLVLLPSAGAWLFAQGTGSPGRLALAGVLVALVLPACLLQLPGDNQSKLLNLAFLLAAAPAAVAWARIASRHGWSRSLAAAFAVALLPTLTMMAWAYAHQSERSADTPSRPPRAIVFAVRQYVPADAVLVDATQDSTRGAAPALPGETGRALLWSGGFMARKWGYAGDALQARAYAAAELAHGRWPTGRAGQLLARLAREPWVIARDDSARSADPGWRVVTRADGVVLARIAAHE